MFLAENVSEMLLFDLFTEQTINKNKQKNKPTRFWMKPFYYISTCIPMNEWFLIYQQTLPKTTRLLVWVMKNKVFQGNFNEQFIS